MNGLRILGIIFCIFALLAISLVISKQSSSPIGQFNVTPDFLYLNWTNNYASNITIEVYNDSYSNISVQILNSSSFAAGNYSQSSQPSTNCDSSHYALFIINSNGDYNNTIGPINESVNVTIIDNIAYNHLQCKPGRYWIQKFTIKNATLPNETANITVYIDIPISSSTTTGIGDFNGVLPVNATTYQSLFFNTSTIPNATGIKISLTGWLSSQDLDLFLLDNSSTASLKSKSINTTTIESLLYSYLPNNTMWELRIYGNSTSTISYSGYLIFTTLNVINTSNPSQQIISINFGNSNTSETKQTNITLKNEGNLTLLNVVESKELYIKRMFGGNGPKNFTLIVPNSSIATKVKASLNWTGASNYLLKIYNENDSLVETSANKHINANKTGVMQEEYNETTNIGSNAGLWRFEVSNTSTSGDPYNLTLYVYVSPNNWITTNYNTMTFNRTGNDNYTTDVQINITVQNNSLDGSYEGYIQYLDNNGAGIKIPLSLNVRTPMLVVNNSLSSMTSTINEIYGVNSTKSLNFLLNNSGYYNLNFTLTNSSGILSCFSGSCSGYFATLNYNQTTFINNYSSEVVNVNITYNTSMPIGVYAGWILINGSNSPISLSSHPYETFNITLKLNLTKDLDIRNFDIVSIDGDKMIGNVSSSENVTTKFHVYYTNGSNIETGDVFTTSNFSIWLTHKNMSSFRIPTSGSLTRYNGTNPIYISDYELNFTVPANQTGGTYDVHLVVNYTKSSSAIYSGEVTNQTLVINSTGVNLNTSDDLSQDVEEGDTFYFNITATNYGPITANGNITFNSCQWVTITPLIATSGGSNCTSASRDPSNNRFYNINLVNGTTCYFAWSIYGKNVSATRSCDPDTLIWYSEPNLNNITVNQIRVVDIEESTATTTTVSSDSGDNGENQQTTTTTTTVPTVKYLNITSYPQIISIIQGSNKTENVTVMNIHSNLTQRVNLTILFIDSNWYNISPLNGVTIANKTSYTYSVNFMIPDNATIKDYSGKFFAESSYGGSTQSFTLRVTPGAKLQAQISANLSSYKIEIDSLEKELNKTKYLNNTEAKSLFNQLKIKYNQASNYLNQSDYRSAYDLLDDIESLLNQTNTALSGNGKVGKGIGLDFSGLKNWVKWVILAVVVIVGVVLAYLFWPTPTGFKPQKGFTPEVKDKKTIINQHLDKLKEKWRRAQERKD